jgi:hypothetical protein
LPCYRVRNWIASTVWHALAGLLGRFLAFALLTFSPQKIFCYPGRKWHARFDGEVQTHYKSVRKPRACSKHFMKRSWLKLYDKARGRF